MYLCLLEDCSNRYVIYYLNSIIQPLNQPYKPQSKCLPLYNIKMITSNSIVIIIIIMRIRLARTIKERNLGKIVKIRKLTNRLPNQPTCNYVRKLNQYLHHKILLLINYTNNIHSKIVIKIIH